MSDVEGKAQNVQKIMKQLLKYDKYQTKDNFFLQNSNTCLLER